MAKTATSTQLGTNLTLEKRADGKFALVFDPKHRGDRSKSGKSVMVATTNGNVKDEDLSFGINIYVKG